LGGRAVESLDVRTHLDHNGLILRPVILTVGRVLGWG
jgi:hypothetical protein